jgi:succinate dehydrogenase/fumarate reductase flavoprotein subunit
VSGRLRVAVVGSGLAGLSCAEALVAAGVEVHLFTPGLFGRDGATQRVHALAPWVLLNAPCQRGDSPQRFLEDLLQAGAGKERRALCELFAELAPAAAKELVELLGLQPMGEQPVLLPGNSFPRGKRYLPGQRGVLLAGLLAKLRGAVLAHERAWVVGVAKGQGRVCGVWAYHREQGELAFHQADAVVLACGGVGAVFGPSTVPRWCRGSALALGELAGALLHHPHLTQALPVLAFPPVYFPTTQALLGAQLRFGVEKAPRFANLEALTVAMARALREGKPVLFLPRPEDRGLLPRHLRESAAFARDGELPLGLAVHHGVGGVAIDTWGRSSVSGLYACGEAAGGVQGARRLMGTGLLEARIFGRRAGQAVAKDLAKRGPAPPPEQHALLPFPLDPEALEHDLDLRMGKLMVLRPEGELRELLEKLSRWEASPELHRFPQALAATRRQAARVILQASLKELSPEGGQPGSTAAAQRSIEAW